MKKPFHSVFVSYDLFIPQLKVSKNGLETLGLPPNGLLYLPPNGETIVNCALS